MTNLEARFDNLRSRIMMWAIIAAMTIVALIVWMASV